MIRMAQGSAGARPLTPVRRSMRPARVRLGSAYAIVLDASERHSLVCARSLARAGIGVGALDARADAPAFASRWCAAKGLVPDCAQDPDAFVDAVIGWIKECSAQTVITVSDGSIEALRGRRSDVERHATLALAGEAALAVATSKPRTLALAAELGIRIPKSVMPPAASDVAAAAAEVGLPLVVKPAASWNAGEAGGVRLTCRAAATQEEAVQAAREMWANGAEPILQEWIPHRREAISLLRAGGLVRARFAQVADRMYPPLGGSSVVRRSIPLPPDSTAAAERLAEACDLEGYCEIEFRRDRSGAPALMEINPRLSASVELAVRAGVDFPLLLHRWATGAPIADVGGYRTGVRMRWLGGDVRRLRAVLADPGRPETEPRIAALATFLFDFLRPARYDYLTLDDPLPAAVAASAFVKGLAGELLERRRDRRARE